MTGPRERLSIEEQRVEVERYMRKAWFCYGRNSTNYNGAKALRASINLETRKTTPYRDAFIKRTLINSNTKCPQTPTNTEYTRKECKKKNTGVILWMKNIMLK